MHRISLRRAGRRPAAARLLAGLVALPVALACNSGAAGQRADPPPLLSGLGDHHLAISTSDTLAQRYFDQGLRLAYAFNHPEALRAFREAARLDPRCAMCEWGVAYVLGPNINAAMDTAAVPEAYAAAQKARQLAGSATERERALIEAMAVRYAATAPASRASLDTAYANAMRAVAARFPRDDDVAALYAEALMDTSPWSYWTEALQPRPYTGEMLAALEQALARTPRHPGVCHFYIHAVEAAYPRRAVACAERLAALMPNAGHIVHMPGHIYIRVGRYNDAIEANVHAVHVDESYIADQGAQSSYTAGYYPHNYHFLALAATLAGRSADAIAAARKVVEKTPAEVARVAPDLEGLLSYGHLALVTFGRWDEVLTEPLPPADLRFATALAQYARGVALAATGKRDQALAALDTVKAVSATVEAEPASTVLEIAALALDGEIAARTGRLDTAIERFGAAMALEDGLPYMEPPFWYYPIRHSLGALLLKAGRPADAERLYRQDLERFPENGWSLFGLRQSLVVQGKSRDAAAVKRRLDAAWSRADVTLTASRF
ncbi:MAG: hypothetical protein ACREJR_08935 [Candidatus Rokuibacteriota bacterium]